jgi:predicted transcriptional regulator
MAGQRTPRAPAPHVLQMEQQVLELRRSGMRFNRIAEELGVTPGRVSQLFKSGMGRHTEIPAAEIKRLEGDRLDDLQYGLWARAQNGDVRAVEQVLNIMERRAKLLGLDHSDKIAEGMLRIEQDKVRLLAVALNTALDAIQISDEQRAQVFQVMERELAPSVSESPPDGPAALEGGSTP